MCIGICRILQPTTGVPDFRIDHTRHVAQNFFHTPEAAGSKNGYLTSPVTRDCRAQRAALLTHPWSPSRQRLMIAVESAFVQPTEYNPKKYELLRFVSST